MNDLHTAFQSVPDPNVVGNIQYPSPSFYSPQRAGTTDPLGESAEEAHDAPDERRRIPRDHAERTEELYGWKGVTGARFP